MVGEAPSSSIEPTPQGPPSTQVTLAGVVPVAIPIPKKSKGVVVAVPGLEDKNVYKDEEDSEIGALFDEAFDTLSYAGNNSPLRGIEKQGSSSDSPSPSTTDIIFSKEFFNVGYRR